MFILFMLIDIGVCVFLRMYVICYSVIYSITYFLTYTGDGDIYKRNFLLSYLLYIFVDVSLVSSYKVTLCLNKFNLQLQVMYKHVRMTKIIINCILN